jgi:hypothetical protein
MIAWIGSDMDARHPACLSARASSLSIRAVNRLQLDKLAAAGPSNDKQDACLPRQTGSLSSV